MKIKILLLLSFLFFQKIYASEKRNYYPEFSVGFVKNKGQVLNQYGKTNRAVLYCYASNPISVHLRKKGFSYQLVQTQYAKTEGVIQKVGNPEISEMKTHRIEVEFEGAKEDITLEELEEAEGEIIYRNKENAEQSITLKHYKKIIYRNIYDLIDIEFLIGRDRDQKSGFKYNIVLHPGANAADVKFRIKGSDKTELMKSGALSIATSLGILSENIPMSYELETGGNEGRKLNVKYKRLGENLFGLTGIEKQLKKSIVVDPVAWVSYFGGSLTDNSGGIICDKDNNVYLAGRTYSSSGIATVGAYQTVFGGGTLMDAYLAKFTATGSLLWATYFGGSGEDNLSDIEIDVFGNIVIAGSTNSTSGIATGAAMQPMLIGSYDGFIARFNQLGNLLTSTYFGYAGTDQVLGICLDQSGAVYATGASNSTVTLTAGTHQPANAGNYDAFIMKMSYPSTFTFATYFGGTALDYGTEIVIDDLKNIFITGYTTSINGIASSGAYKSSLGGSYDGIYAKFDSLGRRIVSTYYGGNGNEYFYDINFDSEGKIIIAGYGTSQTNIALGSVFQTVFGGGTYDAIILKFDTSGIPIWVTYAGGNFEDFLYSLVSDENANIYALGNTNSTSGLATPGAIQNTNNGGSYDSYFLKLDKNGGRLWASYFGGAGNDLGREIGRDKSGAIYFAGETNSPNGIATTGAFQTTLGGGNDAYLLKYTETIIDSPVTNNIISAGQGVCKGNNPAVISGAIPGGGNGTFAYEWIYSASGVAGTYSPASGLNNAVDYNPGSLSTNAYYKRVVKSGTHTDTSLTHAIIFSDGINAGFTINKNIQCLKNNLFVLSDTTTKLTGNLSYLWDFGNGNTSTKKTDTIHYDAAVANHYIIRLITTLNGGCSDTNYKHVYTISDPVTRTITGPDTVFKGSNQFYSVPATNGSAYEWIFTNGTGRSTINTINIKWTQAGSLQLKMVETNGGGCVSDTAYKNIFVKQATGEEANSIGEKINIYPNPNYEGIFFLNTNSYFTLSITITDITGAVVFQKNQNANESIDISDLNKGVYTIQLSDEYGNSQFSKIVLLD